MTDADKLARRKRLRAIKDAERELESALLTLREHFKVGWASESFRHLYYLVRLARKAP